MAEWVGEIRFSDAVTSKLRSKHNLTPDQVRSAVACGQHDTAVWHDHPVYGRRLILRGSDLVGPILVYLRPIDTDDGVWQCLTAWRID
ncbi:MAG TPA: hypothetical protein VG318_15155 [Actinomycetota bacterium]|nr:hypothetical protein [Actinomycetota bacterium]